MPTYLGRIPRIRWGTSFAQELVFALPLEGALAYSDPGEGSSWAMSDAGVEDAWITATDQFLKGTMRRIPRDRGTNPPATGWNETNGVRDWLAWMRNKNVARFYPDGRNLVDSPTMSVDTDVNGVVNDFGPATGGGATAAYVLDAAAQKVTISAAASAGSARVFQTIYGIRAGDVLSISLEAKAAALLAGCVTRVDLDWFDTGAVYLSTGFSTLLNTSASFVRTTASGAVAPANTYSAQLSIGLIAPGAGATGQGWFKNVLVERAASASSAFIDNLGYRSVYLMEPMRGEPGQESDLTRQLALVFRESNRVAFDGY